MKKLNYLIIFLSLILIMGCESSEISTSSDGSNDTGTAGSLARFTIAGNYLYTVELQQLKIFNISDEKKPTFVKQINPGIDIETIFSINNYLFLGSRWGVYIFDISIPEFPIQVSMYSHIYSCDPVVVSGNYAFSTLNSSGACGQGVDQLHIIDISDLENPTAIAIIEMDNPKGLGISGDFLFVCDNGIKIYDVSNPELPIFIKKETVDAYDIIPIGNLLLIAAESGLHEYEYNTDGDLTFVSTLYTQTK